MQGVIIINIFYNEKDKAFKLRANNTDYMMKVCEEGYLAHVYYGNKVPDEDLTYLLRLDESPFTPATNDRDRASFMDTLPFEYPCFGVGDYRESAFKIMDANGMSTCDLRYVSHKMYEGKPKLEGLPATFATEESGCSTLEITMYDKYANIEVVLIYTFCSSGTVDNVIELTIQFLMTGKLRTKLTGMRKVEFKKMYLPVLQILPAAGRTDACPYAESPPQRLFHDETPDKPACSCY